jgi:hypothetical protein
MIALVFSWFEELEGSMVKWMSVFWDVCVHDIGALFQLFWVLSNIYSQQNWSTPKVWQTDQVFASCYPLALLISVLIQFVSVHFSSPWLKVPQTFVFPISAKYIESSLDGHHHWLTTALWENGTKNLNYCERNVHSAYLQLGRYLDEVLNKQKRSPLKALIALWMFSYLWLGHARNPNHKLENIHKAIGPFFSRLLSIVRA